MATYDELLKASEDPGLRIRVRVACIIAADNIRANVSATTPQKDWAKAVFDNPIRASEQVLWSALAQNRAATFAAIIAANDASIQSAVDNAFALFGG